MNADPLAYLIDVVFDAYILVLLLRFLLQLVRADFRNPVSQFVITVTDPPLRPLRMILPRVGGQDTASIVLMVALKCAHVAILLALSNSQAGIGQILIHAVAGLINLTIYVYIIALIVQAIMSWVGSDHYSPVGSILYALNEPLLAPIRRVIPPISGIDLSPLVAIVGLNLLQMILVPAIRDLAGPVRVAAGI